MGVDCNYSTYIVVGYIDRLAPCYFCSRLWRPVKQGSTPPCLPSPCGAPGQGSRTFRTMQRRFAPIFKRFRPRRRDDLFQFETFRPSVRRFAPAEDVSPPREDFSSPLQLRHFDLPCETFHPHFYKPFLTLGKLFRPRSYRTFRTLEKKFCPCSQFFIKF